MTRSLAINQMLVANMSNNLGLIQIAVSKVRKEFHRAVILWDIAI